jgi:hypothetical protein
MSDNTLLDVIRKIPQQAQRQYGTDEQLRYAMAAANKLGLYDAADAIRRYAKLDELANAAADRVKKHICTWPCEVCAENDPTYDFKLHETAPAEDWRDVRAARDFRRD